jgi:hypothetical protein
MHGNMNIKFSCRMFFGVSEMEADWLLGSLLKVWINRSAMIKVCRNVELNTAVDSHGYNLC